MIGLASSAESGAFSVGPAPNYEHYESTEIWANNSNSRGTDIDTQAIVTFGYYFVISTGTAEDSLNIYDASISSDQTNRIAISTGYPVTTVGYYPLDFTCSTGAFVTLDSPKRNNVKVKVVYKRELTIPE